MTEGAEREPILLSALQHYLFCPRQYALIHLEGAWAENQQTAQGQILHRRVDEPQTLWESGVRVEMGLQLHHKKLAISGRADRVEFNPDPFPVETKRGRPKKQDWDRVQLCAQALCLEEMLGVPVLAGALYYAQPKRRELVAFDHAIREKTLQTIDAVHRLSESGITPAPPAKASCRNCSLVDLCLPNMFKHSRSAAAYREQECDL
ncbi:MAG: CRISPR-associated protein Cas4 [bacterium]|nr:CRISPR-associated protein Cas4 [bacterium]